MGKVGYGCLTEATSNELSDDFFKPRISFVKIDQTTSGLMAINPKLNVICYMCSMEWGV